MPGPPMTDERAKCPACVTTSGKAKAVYVTEADAAWGMRGLAKNLGGTHRLNVYPCPKGHGWHVGHRPGTLVKDLKRLKRQQAAIRAAARGSRRRHRR